MHDKTSFSRSVHTFRERLAKSPQEWKDRARQLVSLTRRNIPFRACRSIDSASAAGPRPGIDLPGRRQTAHSSTSYSTRCGTRKRTSGERTDDCATSGADARARHRATARAYAAGRKREQADCQDHEQKIVTHLTSPLSASWVILENLLRRCGFAGGHRSAIALPRVKI